MMSWLLKQFSMTESKTSSLERFSQNCRDFLSIILLSNTQLELYLAMKKAHNQLLSTPTYHKNFQAITSTESKVRTAKKLQEREDTFIPSQATTKTLPTWTLF